MANLSVDELHEIIEMQIKEIDRLKKLLASKTAAFHNLQENYARSIEEFRKKLKEAKDGM